MSMDDREGEQVSDSDGERPPEGGSPAPTVPEPAREVPRRTPQPKAPAQPVPGPVSEAEQLGSATSMIWATGRRKEAVARVRLVSGTGTILVNNLPYDRYFPRETLRLAVRQPLLVTHQLGKHNVLARVEGGGLTGQAEAIRLGIARALTQFDAALRRGLREAGLLTRDPRAKERKKYGQKGARKRFQWTKR